MSQERIIKLHHLFTKSYLYESKFDINSQIKKNIKDSLFLLLNREKISPVILAKEINFPLPTVTSYTRGERLPSYERLEIISEFFKTTPIDIINFEKKKFIIENKFLFTDSFEEKEKRNQIEIYIEETNFCDNYNKKRKTTEVIEDNNHLKEKNAQILVNNKTLDFFNQSIKLIENENESINKKIEKLLDEVRKLKSDLIENNNQILEYEKNINLFKEKFTI